MLGQRVDAVERFVWFNFAAPEEGKHCESDEFDRGFSKKIGRRNHARGRLAVGRDTTCVTEDGGSNNRFSTAIRYAP